MPEGGSLHERHFARDGRFYETVIDAPMTPAPALAPASGAGHMAQLDGLRCFAVLLVLWQHSGRGLLVRLGNIGVGAYGVWLFFVLSAFLITGILLRVRDARVPLGFALKAFYARRFLRIFPACYGLLAVLVVVQYWWGDPMSKSDLAANLLYVTNWWSIPAGHESTLTGHFWSLAIEEQFYVAWPLLVLLAPRSSLPRILLGAALLAVVSRTAIAFLGGGVRAVDLPTTSNLDALAIGALLAWYHHSFPRGVESGERILNRAAVAGAVCVASTFALTLYGHGFRWFAFEEELGVSLVSVWLVHRCARGMTGPAKSVLEWRPIVYIGTISYGVYLFHLPIYGGLARLQVGPSSGITSFAIVTALSVVVAALSWRFYERPINQLKRFFPYEPAAGPGRDLRTPTPSTTL